MSNKRLYKSSVNRMLCGVCGGIAEYFDIDPTLVSGVGDHHFYGRSRNPGLYYCCDHYSGWQIIMRIF